MWDDNVTVDIRSMNKNIISVYISDHQNKFWMSYIYGNPELQYRSQVWDQLSLVAQSLNKEDEWITISDFNQVLLTKDKLSFKKTAN